MTIEKLVKIDDLLKRSVYRVEYFKRDLESEYSKSRLESFLFYSPSWHKTRIERAEKAKERIHNYYRKSLVKFIETQIK